MPPVRKRPPARSSSARRAPAKRSRARKRDARGFSSLLPTGLPRLPVLDQRERDVLGLALVAFGVFMGFVLYGGWNGGRAGHGLAVALGWMLGRARVLTPVGWGVLAEVDSEVCGTRLAPEAENEKAREISPGLFVV